MTTPDLFAATPSKLTQAQSVLHHMKTIGPITALDALNDFGCFRLAARISDLRAEGHDIESNPFKTSGGATIAEYSLA